MSALGQKRTCSPYSITSSAVDNKLGETVSPSDFATLRLITNSNLSAQKRTHAVQRASARLVRQIDCRSVQIEDINLQLHRGRIDSVV
jgi:hypothetical protein